MRAAVKARIAGRDSAGPEAPELSPLALARNPISSVLLSRASSRDQVTSPDRDLL